MDSDEFSGHVNRMIEDNYVDRTLGRPRLLLPDEDEVDQWMTDLETGVPCHVEDSHPQYLLHEFEKLRAQYVTSPIPEPQLRGRDYPDLPDVSGEIPWRNLHSKEDFFLDVMKYPCTECLNCSRACKGLRETHDYESDPLGFGVYCTDCNCGNNIGR
jgi:hypothetical protein